MINKSRGVVSAIPIVYINLARAFYLARHSDDSETLMIQTMIRKMVVVICSVDI